MRMKKRYEKTLPDGYQEVYCIDAGNNKTGVILNVAALVITAVITLIFAVIIKPSDFFWNYSILRNVLMIVIMIAYIILHELVHGAAYKALTKQKLSFGLKLTAAYCGVPDIYVYRKTALIALLAPFVIFIPVFLVPVFLFDNAWDKMYSAFLLALHIGGCSGDLYDTILYLFRFKDPNTLMRDTGPKQTFYVKKWF